MKLKINKKNGCIKTDQICDDACEYGADGITVAKV
jgi:hypothetical protein